MAELGNMDATYSAAGTVVAVIVHCCFSGYDGQRIPNFQSESVEIG